MDVFVTGDVHHDLNMGINEVEAAEKYVEVVRECGVKATLFVTGKCVDENQSFWRGVPECIELGGHTYSAWSKYVHHKKVFHWLQKKLFGCEYGCYPYQWLDIKRTVNAFKRLDVPLISWRTHGYASNATTRKILQKHDVKIISDTPDTVVGGELLEMYVDVADDRLSLDALLLSAKKIDKMSVVFNLHPSYMRLDNFKTLKSIISVLMDRDARFLRLKDIL